VDTEGAPRRSFFRFAGANSESNITSEAPTRKARHPERNEVQSKDLLSSMPTTMFRGLPSFCESESSHAKLQSREKNAGPSASLRMTTFGRMSSLWEVRLVLWLEGFEPIAA
jgi:hypothetical protein